MFQDIFSVCSYRYPDAWYKQVTNNPRFYSLAATYNGSTIGVIIAEIRDRSQCNKEVIAPFQLL